MTTEESTELALVFPIDQLQTQLKLVDETITKLLVPEDYVQLEFGGEKKPFIRKTGWERIAFAFGLSFDTVHYWKEDLPDGEYIYHVSVKVWKGSRSATRSASCASDEKESMDNKPQKVKARKPHDVFTTAESRAFGRACISFCGYHGHSAEEMMAGESPLKKPELKKNCTCTDGKNIFNMSKVPPVCLTCGGNKKE